MKHGDVFGHVLGAAHADEGGDKAGSGAGKLDSGLRVALRAQGLAHRFGKAAGKPRDKR